MRPFKFFLLLATSLLINACKDPNPSSPNPQPSSEVLEALSLISDDPNNENGYCTGNSIVTDQAGNMYVFGYYFLSQGFGSVVLSSSPNLAPYLAKYDAKGEVVWAKTVGKNNEAMGYVQGYTYSMALSKTGELYIAGKMGAVAGFEKSKVTGDGSVFLAKYDTDGIFKWAKAADKRTSEFIAYGVAVDNQGNASVTGAFKGKTTIDNISLQSALSKAGGVESRDIFLARFDTRGALQWARSAGGNEEDFGRNVTVDDQGNAYIIGNYGSLAEFGEGLKLGGEKAQPGVFVAKYDSKGIAQWAKQTNIYDRSRAVEPDKLGNVYALSENMIIKMDNKGNTEWYKRLAMKAKALAVRADGEVYLAGEFNKPIEMDGLKLTPEGGVVGTGYFYARDICLAKISSVGKLKVFKKDGGEGGETPESVSVSSNGNVYLTGGVAPPVVNGIYFNAVLANKTFKGRGYRAFIVRYKDL